MGNKRKSWDLISNFFRVDRTSSHFTFSLSLIVTKTDEDLSSPSRLQGLLTTHQKFEVYPPSSISLHSLWGNR